MRSLLIAVFLLIYFSAQSQLNIAGPGTVAGNNIKQHAKWSYRLEPTETSVGKEVTIIFKVEIEDGWYMYSSDFDPNLGPIVTALNLKKNKDFQQVGKLIPNHPKRKFDEIWGGEISYFIGKAEFKQKIKILKENPLIEGVVEYQTCTIKDGACVGGEFDLKITGLKVSPLIHDAKIIANPPEVPVIPPHKIIHKDSAKTQSGQIKLNANKPVSEPAKVITSTKEEKKELSLWAFFLKAFLFGLAALITPCVFPMIPMTVSFFTHSSKTRSEAVRKALLYGLSIVGIYTLLGTGVAALFGADAANFISTHWLPNILFFGVFVIFAASFLGMFEIVLPSSLVNKIDQQSEKGGYAGIFFMAFTIALVSFSCTGPIIGTVLIESAGGMFVKPIIGMLGFSMAFAIPFTLFAMFPSWLKSLPKSGGWLNSVKVTLGFLELAFALKFLSQADQVYHWRILDREVFIALWIVIFSLLGLYLLKKIKLSHDDEDYNRQSVSVPRLLFSIASFSFVAYLVPGMYGAPLKALSGYLPPVSTLDFQSNAGKSNIEGSIHNPLCEVPKHEGLLHIPHNLPGYFDLKQGQTCAMVQNKPVFIDFTGHGCANCREMEANVWSNPEVLKRLREDFVIVSLYVDERTELPESEWYVSTYDGKTKSSIGKQNSDMEIRLFNNNAQPLYVITDWEGKTLVEPKGYDKDATSFIAFLD
ncbi:MAG: thioredoxin family protein, partial [Opitutaceae bacterium]|nr:thioredoxin family protein [Cytophagales bacterium]